MRANIVNISVLMVINMKAPPEKLGSFYLGAEYDIYEKQLRSKSLNYDARDLTTHAICVGMTGSGKTGLCVGLLEEAALDKVPAIIIDPKGDVTNLLLQFPGLRPDDFLPWINPDDARRRGRSIEEYSIDVANLWREGLSSWGITSERIKRLGDSAEFVIYTPGSDSGLKVNLLDNLSAPVDGFSNNEEMNREKINGIVSALLELIGTRVDPVRSREAILLSTIFQHYWEQGEDLDLEKIVLAIQNPPFQKLGFFDLDTFYPQDDRFELALNFNSLVAAPSFQSWLEGEPLDINNFLYTDEGVPKQSIFYLAHLSDHEKMFFVTLLLENILSWVRSQSGTTSLRALLYFDEVFGYMPPVAEPPSKRPLLTLLKQARAFGLGLVLVTQNPVDLDYKGLTNTGTWFIGRLQTERDKNRVLEGLEGAIIEAGKSYQRKDFDNIITSLDSRVFLMHNVHEDKPVVFHTRWVMSYLRGPLTRPQVRQLMFEKKQIISKTKPFDEGTELRIKPEASSNIPYLDPRIPQLFLPITMGEVEAVSKATSEGYSVISSEVQLFYEPFFLASVFLNFVSKKYNIDEQIEKVLLYPVSEHELTLDWDESLTYAGDVGELSQKLFNISKEKGPFYGSVPENINTTKELKKIGQDLSDWLYYNERLELNFHPELNILQQPKENEREYLAKLRQAAREKRDNEIDKLEKRFEKKIDKITDKTVKLNRDLEADEAEYKARKQEEIIGVGETILSFFIGRKRTTAGTTIARRRRMTSQVKMDMEETKEEVEELEADIKSLEKELQKEVDLITDKWENAVNTTEKYVIKPRRRDVNIKLIAVGWAPNWSLKYREGAVTNEKLFQAYNAT
jgi:hypothetical protein